MEAATSDQNRLLPESSSHALVPREWFAETLGRGRTGIARSGWICAPVGAAIHGAAFCAIILTALWSVSPPMERPALPALVLTLAPPPPPPQALGSPQGTASAAPRRPAPAAPARTPTSIAMQAPSIPETMLAYHVDVPLGPLGVETGFVDGDIDGMPGGVPGGVLGGVPGGLVGGVVGGTGSQLPRFPKPDVGPSPIRMPQPSYTRQAIRDNVEGAVVLRVVIDEQGKVEVLQVLRSVPGLDEEAIRVVESRWRFQPATKNGRPVSTLSDLVVRFHLY